MKLKQKFILLVSAIGFYTAYTNLKEDVESELSLTMAEQAGELENWLDRKSANVKK